MIDIIIPVYNTPLEDLKRCLDSILNQSYKDYKVYIIDDGSNDETKKYIDFYTKDKDKFIVKHIKNNGVSNARNIGIELSNSKYITFVDSDDTLEKSFLKEAYKLIENNNLDIVIGGYNEIVNNKITRVRKSLPGLHIYEQKDIIRFQEKLISSKINEHNKEIDDTPVGRIYTRLFKKSSIGKLKFNTDIHMSEDTLFMIDYSYQINRIGIIDSIWYNYYINEYSISNATKKDKLINNINDFNREILNRMNKESIERLKETYKLRIDKNLHYINTLKKK